MHPEDGRSAIAAASRAIADFRLGRVDEETSANVGVISGGTARNVVPEWCSFTAEVRSHDEAKAVDLAREMLESAAFAASLADCEVESEVRRSFPRVRFRESDPPVRLAAEALERAGYRATYALSGGGADANVFNARGLQCVNLANGMMEIHTPDEHIAVADLEGMVDGDARARRRRLPRPTRRARAPGNGCDVTPLGNLRIDCARPCGSASPRRSSRRSTASR